MRGWRLLWRIRGSRQTSTEVFAPSVPPPPGYRVEGYRADEAGLEHRLAQGDRRFTRSFSWSHFDGLLVRCVERLRQDPAERSPRQHAHAILALHPLLDVVSDGSHRARVASVIDAAATNVLDRQETDGGWRYSYGKVQSTVFRHGGQDTTVFPDLQYTIDAAVPGMALAREFRRTGDERLLDAALRALSFLENQIGQVDFEGQRIWLTPPTTTRPGRTGTAVNYELWIAAFLASLHVVAPEAATRARIRDHIRRSLDYAERHLQPNGDIGYGDYVRENRTAYASWDAYLLTEIGASINDPRAAWMAGQILGRIAEVMLPCGAIPNVSDHSERLEGWTCPACIVTESASTRSAPTTSCTTLLRAAWRGQNRDFAMRSFCRSSLYEPVSQDLFAGFRGRGERTARSGVSGADWFILALATLSARDVLPYRPCVGPPVSQHERLKSELTALHRELPRPGAPTSDRVLVDLHRGAEGLAQTRIGIRA